MTWADTRELRRRSCRTLLAVTALLAGLVGAAPAAFGGPTSSLNFTATASAATYEIAVRSGDLALASEYVVAMPTAQAELGSSGLSKAYAAAPYPSEVGTVLPGLLNTALGRSEIPAYPLIAVSQAGTKPDAEVKQGPMLLRAHSDLATSRGLAHVSAEQGSTEAVATATVKSGGDSVPLLAIGDNVFKGIALGGDLLAVGQVHSTAQAKVDRDGRVTVSSDLDVSGLSISGVQVTLSGNGLAVGQDVQVPVSLAELKALLAAANITLDYLEPRTDPDRRGVIAAGIQITSVVSPPGRPAVTVVQTLGRARARIDGVSIVVEASASPVPASTQPAITVPPSDPRPTTVATVTPVGPVDAPPPATASGSGTRITHSALAVSQFRLLSLYLAIVVAAGLVGSCGLLFRYLAVQSRWT